MALIHIRLALLGSVAVLAGAATLGAQPPQGSNNSVQVGVPQGGAQDQGAAARAQQQQQERNRLANQPAPRRADGRIVLGNTPTLKGVWIGGGLGFCNA